MPIFGAHESIAGGFDLAVKRLVAVGGPGRALQLFVKSPQQHAATQITAAQADAFDEARRRHRVEYVVAHASYLVNLAATDPGVRKRSITGFADELRRCAILGIPEIVVHPGSGGLRSEASVRHGAGSRELNASAVAAGCGRVAEALIEVFRILDAENSTKSAPYRIPPCTVHVLLETTAGQGASLGRTFEELATMVCGVREIGEATMADRLGVCIDTSHIYAAGYAYAEPEQYEELVATIDATIGQKTVRAFHINGSAKGLGSHVDRHAHLDEGVLPLSAIARFVTDLRWNDRPMILETPKDTLADGTDRDTANLQILDSLVGQKTLGS